MRRYAKLEEKNTPTHHGFKDGTSNTKVILRHFCSWTFSRNTFFQVHVFRFLFNLPCWFFSIWSRYKYPAPVPQVKKKRSMLSRLRIIYIWSHNATTSKWKMEAISCCLMQGFASWSLDKRLFFETKTCGDLTIPEVESGSATIKKNQVFGQKLGGNNNWSSG